MKGTSKLMQILIILTCMKILSLIHQITNELVAFLCVCVCVCVFFFTREGHNTYVHTQGWSSVLWENTTW